MVLFGSEESKRGVNACEGSVSQVPSVCTTIRMMMMKNRVLVCSTIHCFVCWYMRIMYLYAAILYLWKKENRKDK